MIRWQVLQNAFYAVLSDHIHQDNHLYDDVLQDIIFIQKNSEFPGQAGLELTTF